MRKLMLALSILGVFSFARGASAAPFNYAAAVSKKLNNDPFYKLKDWKTQKPQAWAAASIKIAPTALKHLKAFSAISDPDSSGKTLRTDGFVHRNGTVMTINGVVDGLRVAK